MKKDILISFKELRDIVNGIIDVVSAVSGEDRDDINLNTAINDDLGIDGDDWDDVLMALQKRENLSLDGFHFYDHFSDEGQISSGITLNLLILPFRFIAYFLTSSRKQSSFGNFGYVAPEKHRLTIADLVTSKIEGRFVRREDRRFLFFTR